MFAIEVLCDENLKELPRFLTDVDWFIENRPELVGYACSTGTRNGAPIHILSIVNQHQLKRILERLWNPDEFLSKAGIRSLSKSHEEHPFVFGPRVVRYEPAEGDEKLKGGNSNWRGPIWFPTCYLIIESLVKFGEALGPEFAVETKATGNRGISAKAIAEQIANRLIELFQRDATGKRAIYGGAEKFRNDPHWRDYLLFYEYFDGDNGAGLGASHQTGWTSLVANLIDEWRR